jgi:predicted Rossmann fold flavoprotein
VENLDTLMSDYDFVAVCTGGSPRLEGLRWLADAGHEIAAPVPSLFTLSIDDAVLRGLMGTVVEHVTIGIPGTKLRADGPLLITHWGMSGPAILRLSSYAARHLADCGYRAPLAVNWVNRRDAVIRDELLRLCTDGGRRQLTTVRPFGLTTRLWTMLAARALGSRAQGTWASLNQKELNRLVNTLANDTYAIDGRAPFKDEFVTCGGIALSAVNPATLESRHVPRLYFAGEVLDIDGVTGGFNFQAAWTTAHTVATAIAARL